MHVMGVCCRLESLQEGFAMSFMQWNSSYTRWVLVLTYVLHTYRCAPASLPCQKHFQLSEMWSGSAEWFSSQVSPCHVHAALTNAFAQGAFAGNTRWLWWQKRNKCWCICGPGSELFLCSSNWLFAAHVFCSKDVSWAGGNDTRALGQSQLNKLLEFCDKCQSGAGTAPDLGGGHCLQLPMLLTSGEFRWVWFYWVLVLLRRTLKIKELDEPKLGRNAFVFLNWSPHWTIANVIKSTTLLENNSSLLQHPLLQSRILKRLFL